MLLQRICKFPCPYGPRRQVSNNVRVALERSPVLIDDPMAWKPHYLCRCIHLACLHKGPLEHRMSLTDVQPNSATHLHPYDKHPGLWCSSGPCECQHLTSSILLDIQWLERRTHYTRHRRLAHTYLKTIYFLWSAAWVHLTLSSICASVWDEWVIKTGPKETHPHVTAARSIITGFSYWEKHYWSHERRMCVWWAAWKVALAFVAYKIQSKLEKLQGQGTKPVVSAAKERNNT